MISFIARARELRVMIEALASVLEDDNALECVEFFPVWHTDTAYITGDRVRDPNDNFLYKCKQAHTSQSDWTPAVSTALWAKVLAGQDGTDIGEWEQPISTNGYMMGDKVTHNGHTWESTVDNNVWEPGVYGWIQLD